MAKKGQAQLQVEINTEDEWEKLLEREGLIVIDVFSEWCGPCSAMSANLKKIKLEIGGDYLHLAMAKSNGIECLERFRERSEPTWLFIAGGKMVNLLFGADSPKLMRVIIEELKKEEGVRDGSRVRDEHEITELVPEEQERFDLIEKIKREEEEEELELKIKAIHDRRVNVAEGILEGMPHAGIVVVFPQAKDMFHSVLDEVWEPAGLKVSTSERARLTEEVLDELLYFTEDRFSDTCLRLIEKDPCIGLLIKSNDDNPALPFDEILLRAIYGESMCPPGSPDSPAQKLMVTGHWPEEEDDAEPEPKEQGEGEEDEEEEEREPEPKEMEEVEGVWVPSNSFTRATAIKTFTPAVAHAHIPPAPEPTPPYLAIVFDAYKRRDVMALVNTYPKDVMKYGYFTDENPETAKLIAKSTPQFERKGAPTKQGEKMVLQLSRKRSDTVLAFAELGASYISPNPIEGKRECALFFPKGYVMPEEEDEEEFEELPSVHAPPAEIPVAASVAEEEGAAEGGAEEGEAVEGEEGAGGEVPEAAEEAPPEG